MTRLLAVVSFLCLLSVPILAQSLIKQADRQFDQLAFSKAADLYERALSDPKALSETERRSGKARLGYSYHQLRDMKNAERVYQELINSDNVLPGEFNPYYLYYAQTLASNGKYREAQAAYARYSTLQVDDKRSPRFTKLYRDVSALTRNAGSYRVDFLTLNTSKAEFSPTLYKDGLVFVATGNGGNGVKRVFNWNNSPFLDLFYIPELSALRGSGSSIVGGSSSARRKVRDQYVRRLGTDDYTASTSNDSRTVGTFANGASTGYEDRPMSESDQFSRTLNSKYHEGPATFSQDGSRVIFTRNNFNNGQYRESKDGINKLKLYTAQQTNGNWTEIEELPLNSDEYSTGHPALSKDDQLLYFSSDRPGGFGGTDIYVSKWTNEKWGEPVNLGKEVNSKGDELFPFVDEKGNLYFSSNGHAGLGDLDIFYTQLSPTGQQAQRLHNLGEPLNSPKDDFGIVTDGDRKGGFFSSNRKNGGADDDIYRFVREGSLYPCRQLTVSVFDAESNEPLVNTAVAIDNPANDGQKSLKTDAEGLIRLCLDADSDFKFMASREGYLDNRVGFTTKDLSDDEPSRLEIPLSKPGVVKSSRTTLRGRVLAQADKTPIANANVMAVNECDGSLQQTRSGPDGTYQFEIAAGCAYQLEAMKDNMGNVGSRITAEGLGSTDLYLFKKGDIIRIDNIYYDLNKAAIRPDAATELDKVAGLMAKYPTMTIEMRAHTDSRATSQYNKTLSANRARSVVAYLKKKGVAAKRMVAKGYGETELLNGCKDGVNCPEDEHQQNRRTEIKILKLE